MILSCIIVDDEPPAIALLKNYVAQTPFLELKASFSNAAAALNYQHEHPADLIFLDIQMPGLTGIELARILSSRQHPAKIVFTTAFESFALEGYRLGVIDYLVKPFAYEDFFRAADKALSLSKLQQAGQNQSEFFLYLNIEHQKVKLNCRHIRYIEGLKDYAKIYVDTSEKPLLSLISLKSLEEKLPPNLFMRIHKSYIVALDRIVATTKNSVQIDDIRIPVSKPFLDDFTNFLKNW